MPKRVRLTFLIAAGVILAGQCPSFAADKIRIAVANFNITLLPAEIAAKKGYFRDEGLEAEIIRISAPVSIGALASGDIDYTMVLASSVRAAVRGLPVKLLASFIDSLAFALIAQPGIKSVAELRGKTLGVATLGDASDLAARMMIRHHGVDPEKEMKILSMVPDSARLAALKEKLIDVAVASPPADAQGKKMGFNILARAHEVFRYPAIGLCATDKKINERPEEVRRTLKAFIRASRYMREDRAGTIQTLMEWAKVDKESATAAYDGSLAIFNTTDGNIPEDGLRLAIEQAKKESKISREIAPSEVSNLTLLREAQKELRAKGR